MPDDTTTAIRRQLDEIAPYPASAGDATAGRLSRWLAARALVTWTIGLEPFAPAVDPAEVARMLSDFAAAHALDSLAVHDAGVADVAAREIFGAWEGGEEVGPWLWQHLGPDHARQVNALARQMAGEAQAAAGGAGDDLAWPPWLEGLDDTQRIRAIVTAAADCATGPAGHEGAPGDPHCTRPEAGMFLGRLLRVRDQAIAQAEALIAARDAEIARLRAQLTPLALEAGDAGCGGSASGGECGSLSRFAVERVAPPGGSPVPAGEACGEHLLAAVTDLMDDDGDLVIVRHRGCPEKAGLLKRPEPLAIAASADAGDEDDDQRAGGPF